MNREQFIQHLMEPELDSCACGHIRGMHEADADFDEGKWRGYWGQCLKCKCEKFEDRE
jgi:hypothetical protein